MANYRFAGSKPQLDGTDGGPVTKRTRVPKKDSMGKSIGEKRK